jgi:hypothetical protein
MWKTEQPCNPSRTLTPDSVTDYEYDYNNRLVEVSLPTNNDTVEYTYNAMGRRLKKKFTYHNGSNTDVTTYKYHYIGGQITEIEIDSIRNPGEGQTVLRDEEVKIHLGANSQPISYEWVKHVGGNTTQATYYYHYDIHGNVLKITDSSENVKITYTYDTLGSILTETNPDSILNFFTFRGASQTIWDSEVGMYYSGGYYRPDTGTALQGTGAPVLTNPASSAMINAMAQVNKINKQMAIQARRAARTAGSASGESPGGFSPSAGSSDGIAHAGNQGSAMNTASVEPNPTSEDCEPILLEIPDWMKKNPWDNDPQPMKVQNLMLFDGWPETQRIMKQNKMMISIPSDLWGRKKLNSYYKINYGVEFGNPNTDEYTDYCGRMRRNGLEPLPKDVYQGLRKKGLGLGLITELDWVAWAYDTKDNNKLYIFGYQVRGNCPVLFWGPRAGEGADPEAVASGRSAGNIYSGGYGLKFINSWKDSLGKGGQPLNINCINYTGGSIGILIYAFNHLDDNGKPIARDLLKIRITASSSLSMESHWSPGMGDWELDGKFLSGNSFNLGNCIVINKNADGSVIISAWNMFDSNLTDWVRGEDSGYTYIGTRNGALIARYTSWDFIDPDSIVRKTLETLAP